MCITYFAEALIVDKNRWAKVLTGPFAVAVWAVAVLAGLTGMVRYQMTPAAAARQISSHWPAGTTVTLDSKRPTLVMVLHPQCPCSTASVNELAQILSRADGHLAAHVLFMQPPDAPADWLDGKLWKSANALPGASVAVDKNGVNAMAFGAETSGQVVVYDMDGNLRFSGGITDGRGHEGDNPGFLAVLDLVRTGKSKISETPVYGCSLGKCPVP